MALYLIGLGLTDEKDITIKGLETVQKCDLVYLEGYTSLLQTSKKKLENFYRKEIILADRKMTEQDDEKIISLAKSKNVAFLIIGDVFSATTHIQLFKLAKERDVPVQVINNASILNTIGIVGLELYKYGKTTSIPFIEDHPQLETPYQVLKENQKSGLHTLLLLDLKPKQNRFMTINEAILILEKIETRKKENLVRDDLMVVGCARLGNNNFLIKSGKLKEIKKIDFGEPLHCLIIPGEMHFMEEEMLNLWS